MNTRRGMLIIVSGVLLCILVQKVQANPNHLEPIPIWDDFGYCQAVFKSFIGEVPASLWMIERPGFSREYAVILRREVEYDPNDTRPAPVRRVVGEQWFVVHVTPKEKIWQLKRIDKTHMDLDIRPTENVEIHCTPVTKDFAQAMEEAWWSVLQLTRTPKGYYRGPDGTTLQFCCGCLSGEIWTPRSGLPAMLADLGRKLGAVALSDEKNRTSLFAEAESLARKIAKDAEAEQIKLFGKKRAYITWSSVLDRDGSRHQSSIQKPHAVRGQGEIDRLMEAYLKQGEPYTQGLLNPAYGFEFRGPMTMEQLAQAMLEEGTKNPRRDGPSVSNAMDFINNRWLGPRGHSYRPGDEFYFFRTGKRSWDNLVGSEGYLLRRKDEIIDVLVTVAQ